MRLCIALVLLLAAPAVADGFTLPVLVPGEWAVVEGVHDFEEADVRVLAADGSAGAGRMPVDDGRLSFEMPRAYGAGRRFLPGQVVSVNLCSVPVTEESSHGGTSSLYCAGAWGKVGGRVSGVRLAPVAQLAGARWRGWGTATARARRRGVRAKASALVECDGTIWYSRVTVRARGRVRQLHDLAPCR